MWWVLCVKVRHSQAQVELACTIAIVKYADIRDGFPVIQEKKILRLDRQKKVKRSPLLIQMDLLSLEYHILTIPVGTRGPLYTIGRFSFLATDTLRKQHQHKEGKKCDS